MGSVLTVDFTAEEWNQGPPMLVSDDRPITVENDHWVILVTPAGISQVVLMGTICAGRPCISSGTDSELLQ